MKCTLLVLGFLITLMLPADAATCFWVGGTGNFDNTNAASWSSSSGGAGSTCAATGGIPKNAGDIATFDGSSGGGTVTVCGAAAANCPSASGSLSIAQITMGAFTGTLDFATNDPNVTLTTAFSGTGSATRTLNMGDGTFTLSGNGTVWSFATVTGLTFNANGSTILLNNATGGPTFAGGGLTYNIVTFSANPTGILTTGANTYATLNISGPRYVQFASAATNTITNAFTWVGSASVPLGIQSANTFSAGTISIASGTATCAWCAFRGMTFSGGATFSASNSFDLGVNTGITISPPTAGGRIIGG